MGSASARCGVTGLEIQHLDPVYACFLDKHERGVTGFSQFAPTTPFIRGEYDEDTGGFTVNDTSEHLSLFPLPIDNGDHIDLSAKVDGRWIWYVSAKVFDALSSISMESAYHGSDTFQTSVDEMTDYLRKEYERCSALKGTDLDELELNESAELAKARKALNDYYFTTVKNLARYDDPPAIGLLMAKVAELGELDPIIPAYERIRLVEISLFFLGRTAVPVRGPQFGGAEALKQLNKIVDEACDEQLKNLEEEL